MRTRGYLWVFPGVTKDVVTFDKISHLPCLALLGEPGIGKSHALQVEFEQLEQKLTSDSPESALFFNLRSYSSETRLLQEIFENEAFEKWQSGSHRLHLFLDSLDEGLLRIDTLTSLLVDKLSKIAIERLNLRIACRTAEWSNFLEANLKKLWGEENFSAYELVSLQQGDVLTAAKTEGLDSEAFVSEIAAKNAEPLAAKPITLRLLLNLFRPPNALPNSQAEIYERGCLLLCEEENERRKTKWSLTARQRFQIAARIAAITIFGNKASIWVGSDTGEQTESDVTISEIAGGLETGSDGIDFHITEDAVRETLSATSLFTSRGLNRLGWQHQTYAEFLASWYLDNLNLDEESLLQVLRSSDDADGLLVPQLYETTAWLASARSELFRILMHSEPLVLLRSDVLSADDAVRFDLTESLLKVCEEEREFDRWEFRSYYSKLKHSTLAEQLLPYVSDKSKGLLVRRVAIDIGKECKVTALQNELADIALDPTEEIGIRAGAAATVVEIGDSPTKARLKPLAFGNSGEDPQSELKGYGLMSVWPGHMTAKELFTTLIDPPSLYGSYKSFLNTLLVAGLKDDELSLALDWVKNEIRQKGAFDFDRKTLSSEILVRAWNALDDERVMGSFVEVVMEKIKHYDELLEEYDTRDKLLEMRRDMPKRQHLLRRLFPLLTAPEHWMGFENSIVLRLGSDDVPWLLNDLRTTNDLRTRATLFSILKDFLSGWQGVAPESLSEIHSAMRESELIRQEFAVFFEPIYLDSAKAITAREAYERAFAWKNSKVPKAQDQPLTPTPAERVRMMLNKFEEGETNAWWQLNLEMTLEVGSKFYGNELEIDLRKLPGWTNETDEIRDRIIEAARKYVRSGEPQNDEWLGRNTIYRPAFSGYRALWLLRAVDPSFVNSLSTDEWRKWAAIIFHYPIYNGSGESIYNAHRQFIGTAYRAVPEEITSLLSSEIDRFAPPNRFVDFDILSECWDETLLGALRRKLHDNDLHPQMFLRILTILIEHRDKETIAHAHGLLTLPIPLDQQGQERAKVAASALFLHEEDAGWHSVWPAITSDPEFGRRVMESVVTAFRIKRQTATKLSEAKIADLYLWLSEQYPPAEDPQFPAGEMHFIGTREEMSRLRDSLLSHLTDRGTKQAVRAIEQIAKHFPHLEWMKWTLLEARKNLRQHSWKPLLPGQIIGLRNGGKNSQSKMSSKTTTSVENDKLSNLWGLPIEDIANLDDLVESYRSFADRFTFFVGAGLAVPIFPLWDELLRRMIEECENKKVLAPSDKNELLELLSHKKDFLDIAATCARALEKHDYRGFIEEQFDLDIDITKLPAYQELIRLRPNTIVTTNFDQIPDRLNGLSFSFDGGSVSSGTGYYDVYTNRNVTEANNAWKKGKPIVFKMHGCVKDHDSIVLTREDFRREIYRGFVKEFLKAIFSSQTVVFLGFGFSDPHIDAILSFLYEVNSGLGSPHYVLANDLTNLQKQNLQRNYGVRVINYTSTPGHPQVVDFIRFLRSLT
jgi:predicted NACHT family NTPase